MRLLTTVPVVAGLVVAVAGVVRYGAFRWRAKTRNLRAKMESARLPIEPARYDAREIASLPVPVQRYFGVALTDGQAIIAVAQFSQKGQFRIKESETKWSSFTASQIVTTRPPGFDWDARIRMAPGVTALVHDAYVAGEGMLHAEALGLVTVADLHGTPAAAQGELLRYLAEAAWYPTALLPSQGVRWEAIDDSTARAMLTDGATTVSLEFRFDAEGLIASVRAASRYRRDVNGVAEFAPWQGRFWAYAAQDGMRIPSEGEVGWQLPAVTSPYWRGRITDMRYEFAQ